MRAVAFLDDSFFFYYDSVDDIEDNSHLRRGVPVAHKVYGVAQTINASNYVYFLALAEVMKLSDDSRATVTVFTGETMKTQVE